MIDKNELDVDKIVDEVYTAVDEGHTRPITSHEIMRVRLAALAAIVRNMQETVEKDYQLITSQRA